MLHKWEAVALPRVRWIHLRVEGENSHVKPTLVAVIDLKKERITPLDRVFGEVENKNSTTIRCVYNYTTESYIKAYTYIYDDQPVKYLINTMWLVSIQIWVLYKLYTQ